MSKEQDFKEMVSDFANVVDAMNRLVTNPLYYELVRGSKVLWGGMQRISSDLYRHMIALDGTVFSDGLTTGFEVTLNAYLDDRGTTWFSMEPWSEPESAKEREELEFSKLMREYNSIVREMDRTGTPSLDLQRGRKELRRQIEELEGIKPGRCPSCGKSGSACWCSNKGA